jgi:hypothetical protein
MLRLYLRRMHARRVLVRSPLLPLSPVRPASAVFRVETLAAKPLVKQFGVRSISKTKHNVICVAPPHAVATRREREDATEFVFDVVILAGDLIGAYGDLIWPLAVDFAARQFALTPSHRKSAVGSGRTPPEAFGTPGRLFAPVREHTDTHLPRDRLPSDAPTRNRHKLCHYKLLWFIRFLQRSRRELEQNRNSVKRFDDPRDNPNAVSTAAR